MAKKTQSFQIAGMTCTSCEVIIERKLKKVEGVIDAQVTHSTGRCIVTTASGSYVKRDHIIDALADTEYAFTNSGRDIDRPTSWRNLLKIGVTFIVVYIVATRLGLLAFDTAIGDSISYAGAFGIGLIASVSSCIAVVGGLVLTFTATTKRLNEDVSKWQLFRAHLFFNSGRLLGYFFLGGLVAILGAAITPSLRTMGLISLVAALVMVLLALDLLGLGGSKKWIPRMPKKWSHWIHDIAERGEWWIPFLLGALTFFLPCGFTQSMQLYALTTGSFTEGALTLLFFALGTLPALLGIAALASVASSRGKAYRWFMVVSGCIVLLLGVYNVKNSMNLLGINVQSWFSSDDGVVNVPIAVAQGVQVVDMAVSGIDYVPSRITIQKGVPVRWEVDGSGAVGCTSVLAIPSLGISRPLTRTGKTVIEFTPTKTGRLPFTCGMGMAYGEFTVVEAAPSAPVGSTCNSQIQSCT